MNYIFSKEELSEIFSENISYDISDICINSKEAKVGDLFVALKGERVDGHDFINDALERGAILVLSEKNIDEIKNQKAKDKIIRVPSTYEALKKLAEYNLSKSENVQKIALTGSVGKTTTKDMIFHILSKDIPHIYASQKNYNSQIGLPICAIKMPRNSKISIFEMGMSSAGDIRKLVNIINPSISLITNIGENHLEFFESPFDIAKAKSEIFEKTKDVAIIPNDSPYADFLRKRASHCKIISFGENIKSDARILSYQKFYDEKDRERSYIVAKVDFFGKIVEYKLNCNNFAFVSNSVAAIVAAHYASNIDIEKLADNIFSFFPTEKRSNEFFLKNNYMSVNIIDDSYNAAPASMRAAIISLGAHIEAERKIAVIGDMLELGCDAVHLHENLSATIDKYGIDLVFACGKLSKRLFENLSENKKGDWKENSCDLAECISAKIKNGDCILIKGSHSMNMNYIVDVLKNRFEKNSSQILN